MANNYYDSLMSDFCRLYAGEAAEAVLETGTICIDGVNFSFVYADDIDPHTFCVICDLGPLGNVDEKTSDRRMLEINFLLSFQGGVQMAVNPDDGMAVSITRLPIEELSAHLLMDGMRSAGEFAKQWQSGEFKVPVPTVGK